MSLINKMLQDLDERRPEGTTGPVFHAQIRTVPDRGGIHPAWWVVVVLLVAIAWIGTWLWMHQASLKTKAVPPLILQAQLPLKLAPALTMRVPGVDDGPAPQSPSPVADAPESSAPEAARDTTRLANATAPHIEPANVPTGRIDLARSATMASAPKSKPVSAPREQLPVAQGSAKEKNTDSRIVNAAPVDNASTMPVKQIKELTPQQRAENEYRNGATLMQQSKLLEATAALEQALVLDPRHAAARQTLVGLLLDSKRPDEAIRRAREGLALDAGQTGLAMILARLQIDRGELEPALATLQKSVSYAAERADYQAFLAALLQRAERHKDAVSHYMIAVRKSPQNGVWWMGMGISLQAENRVADAQDAFAHAKTSGGLSPELQAFVDQRLSQLQR